MESTAATVPQQQRRRHTVVADSLFSAPNPKLQRKSSSVYMPRKKSLELKEEVEKEARRVEALEAARQTRLASNWEMVRTVNAADD